jgi:tyrosyl-tRNA synthetase
VGINDVITEEGVTVELDVDGKNFSLPPLPANDFLAKAFVWQQSRMQKGRVNSYSLLNVLAVLRGITFQRLIGRDMFQKRIEAGEELYMHEMMYPVLQGIDSSVLVSAYGSCDLEVGGTDQTFNMLMGRDVMKMNKQAPQAVLAFELLVGLDGKEKMSKSLDNYVAITDEAEDMFGKIMSIPDSVIVHYFELCTYTPLADIAEIKKQLSSGKENPRDIKMRLAREIVEIYHGREKALSAEHSFIETFSKGGIPENIPEIKSSGEKLVDLLLSQELVSSKTDFRRLIDSKAIEIVETGESIDDYDFIPKESATIRVGKKRFLKITL